MPVYCLWCDESGHDPNEPTERCIEILRERIAHLEDWVADLQSKEYTTCVYCGHRYGPNTEIPASRADILKEHISKCPLHPMSDLICTINDILSATTATGMSSHFKLKEVRRLARGAITKHGAKAKTSD